MYTNTSITIYHLENNMYSRVNIENVFWEDSKRYNTNKSGLTNADRVVVYIPFSSTNYEPKKGDIIINGVVKDEIQSIQDLEKKYAQVHVINIVDRRDFGSLDMRHWEISGN